MEPASGQVESCELAIKVIRADGTVEDRGTVGYWHRKRLKRWAWHIRQLRKKKG